MKIKKVVYLDYRGEKREASVEDYVELELSQSMHDGGIAEESLANAQSAQSALARLVSILSDKGIISPEELIYIAAGYLPSEVEIVEAPK